MTIRSVSYVPRSAGGVHKLLSTALPTRAFGLRLRYGLRIRRGSFLRPVSCGIVGFPWVAASAPSVRRSIPVVSDRSTTDPHRPLEGTSSCREAHVGERTSTTGSSEAPRPKRQGPSTPTVRSTRAYHRKEGGTRKRSYQRLLPSEPERRHRSVPFPLLGLRNARRNPKGRQGALPLRMPRGFGTERLRTVSGSKGFPHARNVPWFLGRNRTRRKAMGLRNPRRYQAVRNTTETLGKNATLRGLGSLPRFRYERVECPCPPRNALVSSCYGISFVA